MATPLWNEGRDNLVKFSKRTVRQIDRMFKSGRDTASTLYLGQLLM